MRACKAQQGEQRKEHEAREKVYVSKSETRAGLHLNDGQVFQVRTSMSLALFASEAALC